MSLPASSEQLTKLSTEIMSIWEKYDGDTAEIAKQYRIQRTSVYPYLKKYCNEHGYDYNSFLNQPHKPHSTHIRKEVAIMLYLNGEKLSLKQIREMTKKGWSPNDFAEYFSVSVDTFYDALQKITKTNFNDYKRNIESNAKKKVHKMRTPEVAESEDASAFNTALQVVEIISADEAKNSANAAEEIAQSPDSEIEILKSQIEDKKKIADSLATAYSELEEHLTSTQEKQKTIADELAKALEHVSALEAKSNSLSKEIIQTTHNMDEIMEKMNLAESEVEALEEALMVKQTIYVSFDTAINFSRALPEEIEISNEAVRSKFFELSENELFSDIQVKTLRAVAEVLCAVEAIRNAGCKAEISEELCNDEVAFVLELSKENGADILLAS